MADSLSCLETSMTFDLILCLDHMARSPTLLAPVVTSYVLIQVRHSVIEPNRAQCWSSM